jgi:uracil-DNA glycosylase family 4
MPILQKPSACSGCALADKGEGYVPADGPLGSPIAFVAESAGKVEVLTGRPMMGDAGGMLQRLFNLLGWDRAAYRIDNTIRCRPPGDWFDERAPWFYPAITHCKYVEETLAGGSHVIVTLGGTALKRVMGLVGHKKIAVKDWHGTINRDPTDRYWVVPTFHPSFLQRGAHNLIGTVLWDLQQAVVARDAGKPPDGSSLVIDPPLDWFHAWVDMAIAARTQDPAAYPVSVDVETPDKAGGRDEGEITTEDRSFQILRVNLAINTDEGLTVPFIGPYLDELRRLFASPGSLWFWNREYDFVRLISAGVLTEADSVRCVDLMWLWHFLQSDVPRGLGFVAPFYSSYGPWKHLAAAEPAQYGAIDGLQNHRVGFGVIADLIRQGQYAYAMRHTHDLHTKVLRPAQLVGVKVDRARLVAFKQELADKARGLLAAIQDCVPPALAPLTPKGGLTKPPLADVLHVKATAFTRKGKVRAGKPVAEIKQELYAKARVIERLVLKEVLVCRTCNAVDVQRRHRCAADRSTGADATGAPDVVVAPASVTRWFWQEPFNPDSPKQVLAYIKHRKHKPGRAKKALSEESTNRETLDRLARTGDPFYPAVLDYRAVNKVKGTYVEGTERRLDAEDRLHPVPTFKPSTGRLSYTDPNITNVVADKGGTTDKPPLAAGFRRCIVASPGTRLLEVDYSAIEAVEVGACAWDAQYYRLAKLGVHAGLVSHVIGRPYDPSLPDADLAAYFKQLKAEHSGPSGVYDPAKRFIHGRAYGLTVPGMVRQFPHLFPTETVAQRYAKTFAQMAPAVDAWQHATQERAARQHYLGGAGDHPFAYKHWFWSIYNYRRLNTTQFYRLVARCQQAGIEPPVALINGQHFKIGQAEDSKRCLAFYPQSIAAGILKEAMLRLFAEPESPSYIGDAYFGRTPLRAPIHDSLLLEIPHRQWDRVCETVFREMQRPVVQQPLPEAWGMGAHVAIGIAAKAGDDWMAMETVPVPGFFTEWSPEPMEIEDEDDWSDLGRAV